MDTTINALIALCGVLTFLACYVEPIQDKVKSVTTSILLDRMRVSKSRYFNYDRMAMYIKSNGVDYMLSESINPVSFIILKSVVGVLLGVFVLSETSNIVACVVAFVVGFWGVDYCVKKNNENDNKNMLMDIASIYDILKIQMGAGVFVTDSIYFCYKNCRNKRLKDGLLQLYIDILSTSNIVESLRKFDAKFQNKNISTLCAVLEQYTITGQAIKTLDNISKKNTMVQTLVNEQYKKTLEGKYHALIVLLAIGIFGVIFVVILGDVSNMVMNF